MSETWVDVPEYEGLYRVSDMGRVKGQRGRIMKPAVAGLGYLAVTLCRDKAQQREYVHRLVLKAFVGPPPPGMEACHANSIRTDNRLSNLRWDTRQENIRDIVRAGAHPEQRKTHCPRGHPLLSPNLVVGEMIRGHRKCRACNIARARLQRSEVDMAPLADEIYLSIMSQLTEKEK